MKLVSLFFALVLTGCASLLTSNANIHHFYVLNPVGEVIDADYPAPIRLAVQRPVLPGWLDTQNIMLRRAQNQVDFYAEARWVENAGDMLGQVITQSLENNYVVNDIHYSDDELHSNYILETEIIAFQADYPPNYSQGQIDAEQVPVVKFGLHAKLISMPDRKVHARFTINNQVVAKENRLREIIKAFDAAVQISMIQLVQYTARDLGVEGDLE